jgi:hypothetical protein
MDTPVIDRPCNLPTILGTERPQKNLGLEICLLCSTQLRDGCLTYDNKTHNIVTFLRNVYSDLGDVDTEQIGLAIKQPKFGLYNLT